jgi:hypothetical protein
MPRGVPIIYEPEDVRSKLVGEGLGKGFGAFVMGRADREKEDRVMKFRREMTEKRIAAQKESMKTQHGYNVEIETIRQQFKEENMAILKDFDMQKIEYQALQQAKQQIAVAKAKGEITKENEASALKLAHQLNKNKMMMGILAKGESAKDLAQFQLLLTEDAAVKQHKRKKELIGIEVGARKETQRVTEIGKAERQRTLIEAEERMLDKKLKSAENIAAAKEATRLSIKTETKASDVAKKMMDVYEKLVTSDVDLRLSSRRKQRNEVLILAPQERL